MALSVGSVTVSPDGTHTGSGMALALFEAQIANPFMVAIFEVSVR